MFKKRKKDSKRMTDEEIRAKLKETPFEKGDFLALTIAAVGVFLPMVLIVCGIFVFVTWLIFLR